MAVASTRIQMPSSRTVSLFVVLLLPAMLLAQKSGIEERTLKVDGAEREYLLHIPRGFKKSEKKRAPLVIMLHGRTSSGKQAASSYYGWTKLADKEGFVAVFPTALGKPTSWQAAFRGKPTVDTTFLVELIDAVVEELLLDKDRVFMTGHSSGGFMSYSFAALHPDKVAAIGPVAGLNISRSKPKLPVSVISFHGIADDVVAYDQEQGKNAKYGGMPSAIESAAAFAKHNACAAKPERTELHKGKVLLDTWADGASSTRVELYSLKGWKHGWPTGRAKVSATKLIWKFFEEHARVPAGQESDKAKRKKARSGRKQNKSPK
ncbi:MAG: polyhydroxybutyrate depolymerase [Planctomycetota bacterium]|jgi:polyhydroxybutyrate depolymerase